MHLVSCFFPFYRSSCWRMQVQVVRQRVSPLYDCLQIILRQCGGFHSGQKRSKRIHITTHSTTPLRQCLDKSRAATHERIQDDIPRLGECSYRCTREKRRETGWIPIILMREAVNGLLRIYSINQFLYRICCCFNLADRFVYLTSPARFSSQRSVLSRGFVDKCQRAGWVRIDELFNGFLNNPRQRDVTSFGNFF